MSLSLISVWNQCNDWKSLFSPKTRNIKATPTAKPSSCSRASPLIPVLATARLARQSRPNNKESRKAWHKAGNKRWKSCAELAPPPAFVLDRAFTKTSARRFKYSVLAWRCTKTVLDRIVISGKSLFQHIPTTLHETPFLNSDPFNHSLLFLCAMPCSFQFCSLPVHFWQPLHASKHRRTLREPSSASRAASKEAVLPAASAVFTNSSAPPPNHGVPSPSTRLTSFNFEGLWFIPFQLSTQQLRKSLQNNFCLACLQAFSLSFHLGSKLSLSWRLDVWPPDILSHQPYFACLQSSPYAQNPNYSRSAWGPAATCPRHLDLLRWPQRRHPN